MEQMEVAQLEREGMSDGSVAVNVVVFIANDPGDGTSGPYIDPKAGPMVYRIPCMGDESAKALLESIRENSTLEVLEGVMETPYA